MNKIKWTEYEDNIMIKTYNQNRDLCIQMLSNRTKLSIQSRARFLNLTNNNIWNDIEIKLLKDNFKFGTRYCEKIIKTRGHKAIIAKARSLGLLVDKNLNKSFHYNNINKDFFSIPNIQNCYWAGYIASDGSIKNNFGISLSCKISDEIILQEFKKAVSFSGEIIYFKERYMYDKKQDKKYKTEKTAMLNISKDNNICSDLLKHWNIGRNKTKNLKEPNIKNISLCLSYIAGLIDGDGSIIYYIDKNGYEYKQVCLLGTYDLMKWCVEIIQNIYPGFNPKVSEKGSIYTLRISGNKAVDFVKRIKELKIPFLLPRKWDKFNHILEKNNEN